MYIKRKLEDKILFSFLKGKILIYKILFRTYLYYEVGMYERKKGFSKVAP